MTQSEQWHPSDIEAAVPTEAENGQKRRPRLQVDPAQTQVAPAAPTDRPAAKPAGLMTLDRDSSSREAGPKAEQTPPVDVLQRLQETSDRCIRGYESWRSGNDGESELTDSLHELRKVLARIEIELAASHADETAHRPIPIPLHRAHKHGSDSRR